MIKEIMNAIQKSEKKNNKFTSTKPIVTASAISLWMERIGVAAIFFMIAAVNLFHFCYKMNADIAAEAVLADLICESGEWIPETWYPSTELRIFGTPNLAALFCRLTGSMNLAMGISCTLMTALIMAGIYYLTVQLGMEREKRLLFLILCVVIPNHFVILELIFLFASYYGIHVIGLFFILGIYVKTMRANERAGRMPYVMMFLAIVFSFCMGMQGVRGILILSGPLLALEIFRNVYLFWSGGGKGNKKNLYLPIWTIGLAAAGYLGTKFSFSVGQGISRNIRKGPEKLFSTVLPDVLRCIGFEDAGTVGKIVLGILCIWAVINLICILRKILRKSPVDPLGWMTLFFWFSPVMSMLCVAFTTMESSERYYFLFLPLLALTAVTETWRRKEKEQCINNVLLWGARGITLVFILLSVTKIYLPVLKSKEPAESELREVTEFLCEQGFERAYATFENANTITVLADGEVRAAAVASVKDMSICKWLSSSSWYVPAVPYEERTAYVITEAELSEFEEFKNMHEEDLQFDTQIGKYLIWSSEYNFSGLGE